jgi:Domain of unknown function (DUF4124)
MYKTPYALLLLLAVACAAHAETVYKIVQPDGTVVYSDQPAPGAQKLDVKPIQTYQPPALPDTSAGAAASPAKAGAKTPFDGYTKFVISSPVPDATVRDNNGVVAVTLQIEPALQPGHKVEIRLDGKAIGTGRSTSVTLTSVDRGTHTVDAVVMDASGKTLATTPPVTFHLHRATALLSPAFTQPGETAQADGGAPRSTRVQ